MMKQVHAILFVFVVVPVFVSESSISQTIDFNRDIRPILSDTCFKCHGPDAAERQADLRLDTEQGILDAAEILGTADPENSDFVHRVFADDPEDRMPPPESGRQLTAEQKQLLKDWIEQGAQWEPHWAFVRPVAPDVPNDGYDSWVRNEIDSFVKRRLDRMGLTPNPVADRLTLIRRLSLDLTGLPPDPLLIERYVQSKSARWYEELVEEFFRSPHYGEHMARFWLDAARYADTHGLHLDNYREMWLYRDWVIRAFNENLPFSDFVVQQLAGDLLPSPTEQQLIATGFNRAHVTTNEGGSIKEEVRVRNIVDRVATTGTVFMGLTVGCAQCHDHKYDPITQKEFYSLYAFFNSLEGNPMDGNVKDHAPVLRYFDKTEKAELQQLRTKAESLKKEIDRLISGFSYSDPVKSLDDIAKPTEKREVVWFDDQLPKSSKRHQGWKKADRAILAPVSGDTSYVLETAGFQQYVVESVNPQLRFRGEDAFFVNVFLDPDNPPQQIMVQFNNGNWEHRAYWGENHISFGSEGTASRLRLGDLPELGKWVRLEIKAADVGFEGIASIGGIAFSQHGGKVYWDNVGVVTSTSQTADVKSFLAWKTFLRETGAKELPKPLRDKLLNDDDNQATDNTLMNYYLRNVNPDSMAVIEKPTRDLKNAETMIKDRTNSAPTTLIWKEQSKPAKAFVLNRGEYDQPGEEVFRQTPAALPELTSKYSKDRLGLAHWLLSDEHPLTARVTVNRFWQQFFGVGIVATAEDFGAQGEAPTHPELLDWLAVNFVRNGWDTKSLVKKIVMSSTYRQATNTSKQKLAVDPANRFYSRGPRFRLDAETLRDQALAVSGLLVTTIGGPAVKPPQPDGLWYAVGYTGSNTVRFKRDVGHEKVHRRSLYTFWKRTAPPPQMATFDAPSRESCIVRRERTNTPLQALLLMNDPQYVEAARHLAQRTLDQKHAKIEQDVRFIFERAMGKPIDDSTMKILLENTQANLAEFIKTKSSAQELLAIGENPADEKYDVVQLAALTMLANLVMNQDEFLTKN